MLQDEVRERDWSEGRNEEVSIKPRSKVAHIWQRRRETHHLHRRPRARFARSLLMPQLGEQDLEQRATVGVAKHVGLIYNHES